jgi:hypothetical protein
MPYTVCPACGVGAYTAAAYSGVESCTRCGRGLSRRFARDRNGLHLGYATDALERLPTRRRPVPTPPRDK